MDISLFIYLFLSWWTCLYPLAIMTNALWTFMGKFLRGHKFSVPLGRSTGGKLLSHMATLCFASGGTADCFPKRLYRFTFPLAVREVPVSPHLSQHLLLYVFDYSHPSGYEVTSHCGYKVSFEEQKFLI